MLLPQGPSYACGQLPEPPSAKMRSYAAASVTANAPTQNTHKEAPLHTRVHRQNTTRPTQVTRPQCLDGDCSHVDRERSYVDRDWSHVDTDRSHMVKRSVTHGQRLVTHGQRLVTHGQRSVTHTTLNKYLALPVPSYLLQRFTKGLQRGTGSRIFVWLMGFCAGLGHYQNHHIWSQLVQSLSFPS